MTPLQTFFARKDVTRLHDTGVIRARCRKCANCWVQRTGGSLGVFEPLQSWPSSSYDVRQPTGVAMKRRSKAGENSVTGRRRKTPAPKSGTTPRVPARLKSSVTTEETEVARLTRDLNEALEQQAATSEVLGVISSSPSELEQVFRTILERPLASARPTSDFYFG
jgi:hypothetical protein